MKILHIVAGLSIRDGGPPRVALHLARAQRQLGHDVSVLTGPVSSEEIADVSEVSCETSVPVSRLESWSPWVVATKAKTKCRAERVMRGADIVHAHGLWELSTHLLIRRAQAAGVPTVITPHGMLSHYGFNRRSLKKRLAMISYVNQSLRKVSFVHALTASEAQEIRYYAPVREIGVMPNGVDLAEFETSGSIAEVEKGLGFFPGPYVLYLARIDRMKGIDIAIAAFEILAKNHPDLHFLIAGPDYGAQADAQTQVNAASLQSRVSFVGLVSGRLKTALLANAVCFVQPSRHEGFSVSLLEALASGTPVVASDRVDFPGLAASGAGILAKLDPKDIANALSHFLQADRTDISRRASALVLQGYTWQAIAAAMVRKYETCGWDS